MNQMTTFILLFCGVTMLFYVAGIATDKNPMVTLFLNHTSMPTSDFWLALTVQLVATVGGLVLGLVYRNLELGVMSAVTPLVISMVTQFLSVVVIVSAVSPIIGVLILAPMLFLFIITAVDYWRGRD